MSAQHTPGPYEVDGREIVCRPLAGSRLKVVVAKVAGSDNEESDANARLIAAAPDLLKALWLCVRNMEGGIMPSDALAVAALNRARAAIALAGQQGEG